MCIRDSYYTNQWFMAYKMEGIGHIAANHSTWDLELDNITVESLVLILSLIHIFSAAREGICVINPERP